MANLTRYDPFGELARLDPFHNLDEWFRDVGLRPALRDYKMEPRIRIDVAEGDDAYTVHAEIPGVKKEDIHVDVEGRQVSILAEMKRETEAQEGRQLRVERYVGQLSRSFTLGHDIDDDKVEASYTDGVLELKLPKKTSASTKRITIN